MICVLLVAAGAAWESTALSLLGDEDGVVVLKRCVDVDDLLASASTGQADVAVVALDAPGLDTAAIDHLHRHQVHPVAVAPAGTDAALDTARDRARRIGLSHLVPDPGLEGLVDAVRSDEGAPAPRTSPPATDEAGPGEVVPPADAVVGGTMEDRGRVVAVWGPAGAPGRTTVAAGLAAELATRDLRTVLVDADPHAAVAQHLGILDETSGILAAARQVSSGGDLAAGLDRVQRALDERLTVITGLPRPDRWLEVRRGVLEQLLDLARTRGQVVVDTGTGLEEDPGTELGVRPSRATMTLEVLGAADEVVVVGSADPVGLSRLARGLVELRELELAVPVRVVVNRMRRSLGWAERDIAGMVEGFTRTVGLHFLPEDRAGADRALVAGRSLVESGDSDLRRSLEDLVDALAPGTVAARRRTGRLGRLSRRRGGTSRRR